MSTGTANPAPANRSQTLSQRADTILHKLLDAIERDLETPGMLGPPTELVDAYGALVHAEVVRRHGDGLVP